MQSADVENWVDRERSRELDRQVPFQVGPNCFLLLTRLLGAGGVWTQTSLVGWLFFPPGANRPTGSLTSPDL